MLVARAIILVLSVNGPRKQSSYLIGPPIPILKAIFLRLGEVRVTYILRITMFGVPSQRY